MKAMHHVGITVSDLERGIDFYHGVLGLGFAAEPSPVFDDPTLGPAVGVPGAALRQVSLALGDGILELLEYTRPASPIDAPLPQNALGAQHVAFLVDDIHAVKAELESKGVRFYSEVNAVDEGVLAAARDRVAGGGQGTGRARREVRRPVQLPGPSGVADRA